jgi:hypothetical protein
MISWLNEEIDTFEKAIQAAEKADVSKNFADMVQSKSDLMKGLRRFSANCDLIYNQIATDRVKLADFEQVNDVRAGQKRYFLFSNQVRLQEIYVDDNAEAQLRNNVKSIESKYADIQERNLDFFPSQKYTADNLEDAKKILAEVQNISNIINKGIISE